MLVGITHNQVDSYWDDCAPMIERALEKGTQDYTLPEIYAAIKNRTMQLWGWFEDDKLTFTLVTEIINYPTKSICIMLLGAGSGLESWIKDTAIYAWAKDQGCSEIAIYGRKGWAKTLADGWREVSTQFRRAL